MTTYRRLPGGFRQNRSGAVVVEFALIAPVFFAIVFSIIEAGWMMTKVMMLEMALDKTVREMRIGREEGFTHDYVKAQICDRAIVFLSCAAQIKVELVPIEVGDAFPSGPVQCVDRGSVAPELPHAFNAGNRNNLVYVRACAITDPLTPGLGIGLQLPKDSLGGYAIVTQSVFLNEPDPRAK